MTRYVNYNYSNYAHTSITNAILQTDVYARFIY